MLLSLGALGVAFGDIGTSPLYALRECFTHSHGLPLNHDNILGVLSLIIWTLLSIISIKYMIFILRADNAGEGGILSLLALIQQKVDRKKFEKYFLPVGLFGAALLFGDGMITPAISVLSAVEGLQIATPVFTPFILPIAIAILCLLFMFQYKGTGLIGKIFGPIILIWFLVLAALGVKPILNNPEILQAFNPMYAIQFMINNFFYLKYVLASVFLVVTGGEALYADMGHFGKTPIRIAWYYWVFPALIINYLGQGALLISNPAAIENPFYLLAPPQFIVPLVILSTFATVIASQALISGVFSLTRQAVQLGFLPRIRIVHTSSNEIGQIYVPLMNWVMLVGVIWLVLEFRTSSSIAAAYGIAVTLTMAITTLLMAVVARRLWNWSLHNVIIWFSLFLAIDLMFVISSGMKFFDGGWVSILIACVVFFLMLTWRKGRRILNHYLKLRSMSFQDFTKYVKDNPPQIVKGAAIYMAGDPYGVPLPLLQNLRHNKVLHEQIAILTISTIQTPFVKKSERIALHQLSPGFYRIFASYGFMETPKIKEVLDICQEKGIEFDLNNTTFVMGRETVLATGNPGMPIWQEKIFAIMTRNAQRPTAFFGVPPSQVIEVGLQVEI